MNNRKGNKKISLLLILKALEQISDKDNPVKQEHLTKMINDIGGLLNLNIWCDRKTVGRHIKLLKAAGYNINIVKGKGCYLETDKFTKKESELLISLINNSSQAEVVKNNLINKLYNQQGFVNKKQLTKIEDN